MTTLMTKDNDSTALLTIDDYYIVVTMEALLWFDSLESAINCYEGNDTFKVEW